jgi:hypothetical protein
MSGEKDRSNFCGWWRQPKPTIWQRIKWFYFGKPKIEVPEFKSITMPIIKADFPNLNRETYTENSLKDAVCHCGELIRDTQISGGAPSAEFDCYPSIEKEEK